MLAERFPAVLTLAPIDRDKSRMFKDPLRPSVQPTEAPTSLILSCIASRSPSRDPGACLVGPPRHLDSSGRLPALLLGGVPIRWLGERFLGRCCVSLCSPVIKRGVEPSILYTPAVRLREGIPRVPSVSPPPLLMMQRLHRPRRTSSLVCRLPRVLESNPFASVLA